MSTQNFIIISVENFTVENMNPLYSFLQTLFRENDVLVPQSYLALSNLMDCSLPGSSVHGILQVGIPKWLAISFSRGLFWLKNGTCVSCTAGRPFTIWAIREALGKGDSIMQKWMKYSHDEAETLRIAKLYNNHTFDKFYVLQIA